MVKLNRITFGCFIFPMTIFPIFFLLELEEALSQINANGFGQLEIEISTQNLEVEKVGVRLVHKQDKEESNRGTVQQQHQQVGIFPMFNLI
jgi:hypothetical protein